MDLARGTGVDDRVVRRYLDLAVHFWLWGGVWMFGDLMELKPNADHA